jgi:SAM-dependent methyltransferase
LGSVSPTHPAHFHVEEFRLQHCSGCDVVYLDPAPTPADLDALYRDSEQFSDPHYTDADQVARMLEFYGGSLKRHALLPRQGARLLEIGAGLAWVARAGKALDPQLHTIAQDVTAECVNMCPWVDRYHVGELATLTDEPLFDLASMTHVIEHLVDPAKALMDVAARLKVGGKLFVTAPFRPSRWRPGQGLDPWRSYSYLHVPAHVSYLSKRWFKEMGPRSGLALLRWDASHEDGQAFEAVLQRV